MALSPGMRNGPLTPDVKQSSDARSPAIVSKRPIRVCRVINAMRLGGVQAMLVRILPVLRDLGAEPELVVTRMKGPMSKVLYDRTGITTTHIHIHGRIHPPSILKLVKHFRARHFDVVHSHMFSSNIPVTIAARLAGVPCIVGHVHNTGTHEHVGQKVLDRITLSMRDATLCVSNGVRQDMARALRVSPERFRVLYNAVDPADAEGDWDRSKTRARLGYGERDVVLIHAARLNPQKNHEAFLQEFPRLLEECGDLRLLLAGDGELEEPLRDLAKKLGVDCKVQFLGFCTNVPELMRASDIQIFPSRHEGLGNVILEGWQQGLPVVGTDIPGVNELIQDGVNGYLAPLTDMKAFGDAVLRLAENPTLRSRLGEAGRERVRDFLVGPMAERTMTLYEEILRRKGVPLEQREYLVQAESRT